MDDDNVILVAFIRGNSATTLAAVAEVKITSATILAENKRIQEECKKDER
jgi:hypothetical protein